MKTMNISKKTVLMGAMLVGLTVLLSVASLVSIAGLSAVDTAGASAYKAQALSSLTLTPSPADADGFSMKRDFKGMV